jgi:gluconate 2-dehydrogenase gamma chain
MTPTLPARRNFLIQAGAMASAAWIEAQWPAIAAAAQHAHQAVQSKKPGAFEVFTPEQARDVEALASHIIPTDELPGAREAGVVYFIDRALKTFAAEALPTYQKGLADLKQLTMETYPSAKTFASAAPEQQEKIMAELAEKLNPLSTGGRRRPQLVSPDFMQTIWQHTVFGFLADPEAGGNRDYTGWKVIGRDPARSFSPPFGFYDKDYPGWQPAPPQTEKP